MNWQRVRKNLQTVDKKVDERVGSYVYDFFFIFFIFTLSFILLGGQDYNGKGNRSDN